ncbi:unnamed protein product, partial [Tilletia controversa]
MLRYTVLFFLLTAHTDSQLQLQFFNKSRLQAHLGVEGKELPPESMLWLFLTGDIPFDQVCHQAQRRDRFHENQA